MEIQWKSCGKMRVSNANDFKMNVDKPIFISLYQEACEKCFGFPQSIPLSESESKQLSNRIFEHTGLKIGAKSIKNYSIYISIR